MNIIKYPERNSWSDIVRRPHLDVSQLNATVSGVLNDVRENGDAAVKKYEEKFDHVSLTSLEVSDEEKAEARGKVSKDLVRRACTGSRQHCQVPRITEVYGT